MATDSAGAATIASANPPSAVRRLMSGQSSRSADYCDRVVPPLSLLREFARDPGRSVFVRVRTADVEWTGAVNEDVNRPAASLLKLPLAMALEPRLPDQSPQRVGDLLDERDDASVLLALDPDRLLAPAEVLRLMLSASDNPCARWALRSVGLQAVQAAVRDCGAVDTTVDEDPDEPGMLTGSTTARDAVSLLDDTLDRTRFPVSSFALEHSIRNSRIPLGATDDDVKLAHKTGTLSGVASDVAHLTCRTGEMSIAFLTEDQHDILITGYEMGICTRGLLDHFGMQVTRTMSAEASA